jgi:hypothetical protein
MIHHFKHLYKQAIVATFLATFIGNASAQTDIDAIMMEKKNICIGPMFTHSSWTQYWEGTNKRENLNLGTVSANMYSVMGNYGITSKLNFLFGLPYVKTKASAGTLHGMSGLQDASLWLKYMPLEKEIGPGTFSVYGIGGLSFPVSNYVADFLPLSIGMRGTNVSLRGMVDYQIKDWFATASATYVLRSNIEIDRTAYYDTEGHLTNKVNMPNVFTYNVRAGYRSDWLIAEAVLNNMITQGGFDITRNNMPFPSNQMNATTVGINAKYTLKKIAGLSFTGGAHFTVAGRNVGQSNTYNGGIFYIIDFNRKAKKSSDANGKTSSAEPR